MLADCIATYQRLGCWTPHVEITQARMETLLARMIRHEENGRDA